MAPKRKQPKSEDEESGEDYSPTPSASPSAASASDGDYAEEEEVKPAVKPKKKAPAKKTPAKPKKVAAAGEDAEAGGSSGKKKAGPKRPAAKKIKPPTEPTVLADGWTVHPPSLIYKSDPAAQGGARVACFDFDGTLVGVKSGAQFARDADDWKWFSKEVPKVVRQCHADGYQILFISNQGGIKGALTGVQSDKTRARIDNAIAAINKKGPPVPVQVLLATQSDDFRKPNTGMWDFFVAHLNKGQAPDLSQCFYVGDMAGRPTDTGDGQASDRQFAANVGIQFFTPEEKFGESDLKTDFKPGEESDCLPENAPLASAFRQLTDMLKGEPFKANAFRKVAEIIEGFPEHIKAASQLKNVKGVGKSSLAKITEFLETGTLAILQEAGPVGGGDKPENKAAEVGMRFI